jgi:plastocyanin
MPIADDAEPGTYNYYCVIHFPFMQGKLEVKPEGSDLPSSDEVNRRARNEIEDLASPLRDAFAAARRGTAKSQAEELEPPLAGYHAGDEFTVAIDEFVPKTLRANVGEPITWTIVGAHTISFDVPRYLPVYQVLADGTVERNPQVDEAAGGAPKAPPVDFTKGPLEIDGGTWDGSGFYSSGLIGSEPVSRFTLRVSKAGSYRYACLVHPKMVARLVVTS